MQAFARLGGLAVGFISLGITSRFLTTAAYGELASALALVGVFLLLADFGVNFVVLRRVNVDGADMNDLTRKSLGMTAIYVLPVCLLFLLVGHVLYRGPSFRLLDHSLFAYAIGIAAACFTSSLRPLYQQQVRLGYVAGAELLTNIVTCSSYIVIAAQGLSPLSVFYVQALYPIVGLVLLLIGQRTMNLRPQFDYQLSKRLAVEALPLGLGMLVANLYLRADVLILSVLESTQTVGAYGLAYRIISSVTVLSVLLGATVYPRLASFRNVSERYKAALTRLLIATAAVVFPFALLGAITARETLTFVAGASYATATTPLVILYLALVPVFLNGIYGNALALSDRGGLFLKMSCACLIFNVALNFILIPHLGASGAALATLASDLMTTGILTWLLRADISLQAGLSIGGRVAGAALVSGACALLALQVTSESVAALSSLGFYVLVIVVSGVPRALGLNLAAASANERTL